MPTDHVTGARAVALLEATTVGHLLLDGTLRCVFLNGAAARMGGTTVEAATGRPFFEVLPELTPVLGALCRTALDARVSLRDLECSSEPAGGQRPRRRWIASVFPVEDRSGEVHLGVTLVETAEAAGAVGELREREALFRAVFERAPLGMVVIDWRDQGAHMNAAIAQMLGYTNEELLAIGVQGITHPDDFAADLAQFQRLVAGEIDHYQMEKRYLHKDGRVVWGKLVISMARDAARNPVLIISTVEDITERRRSGEERELLLAERTRLLAEAEESLRARDEFLAVAAHELRTPLTPLKLELGGLLRAARAEPDSEASTARTRLERMDRQVDRLTHLLGDLLDVVRMSAGRLELSCEPVDLSEVMRDVVGRHGEQARRAGCDLALVAPAPVVGDWDRGRLEQIATNLLSNAIKFGAGKPIEVAVALEGDRARLGVRDRGQGIPPAMQGRIFDKFERAVSARHYGGLGLGLWICRQIVQALGGCIRVESAPDDATTFFVELPLQQPAA